MLMVFTSLFFMMLTAALVVRHLGQRETGRGSAGAPAAATGPACPRCGTATPMGAAFCSACGTPRQVFEVTDQAAVLSDTPTAASRGLPHAMVLAEKCVGCGTCVAACPVPDAIAMPQKLAVINLEVCQGVAHCADACPVDAIVVGTGMSARRVEVPEVHNDFQTNLPGVFIAGELGGRGLIKNAINEGKMAVESIVAALPPGEPHQDGDAGVLDLVIVGAGPAGLSAGLEAERRGLSYLILEQGSLAETIRKYPREKLLLAEPVRIPLYGDLWVADASKETLLEVWETIIKRSDLKVRTGEPVKGIEERAGLFHVQSPDATYRCRRLLLAMGRRGTPRRLGVAGEELDKVFYDVAEMQVFQNKRVLVVGGGDSAVESALGLANQPGNDVTLSYRGEAFRRLQDRVRGKLDAAVSDGLVTTLLGSEVAEILPDRVHLDMGGEARIIPNDVVIIRIGGEPAHGFLERMGVRIVHKDIPFAPAQPGA